MISRIWNSFVSVLRECYPCFLASCDHRAVVFSLLSASCDQQRRKRCLVSFLQSQETVDDIQAQLSSLQTSGFAQWADSQDLIRRQALAYERTHCCTGYTEVQILLRESTSHKLAPGGHDFLLSKGYDIPDPHVAYRVLAAMAEKADEDRTGQLVLDKLKTTISDPWASQPWRRKQEIWRLTRQLQVKRQLHTLRSKTGQVLPDPESIAQELLGFWSDKMSVSGLSSPQVTEYLRSFFKGKPLAG